MGCHRKQANVETKKDRKEGRKEKMSGRQAGQKVRWVRNIGDKNSYPSKKYTT